MLGSGLPQFIGIGSTPDCPGYEVRIIFEDAKLVLLPVSSARSLSSDELEVFAIDV